MYNVGKEVLSVNSFSLLISLYPSLCQVDAVVLKLTPLIKPAIDVNIITLEKIVKCLFQYWRKYIRKGARLQILVIIIIVT